MDGPIYVYTLAALVLGLVAVQAVRRPFDPFSPVWLFLVGYFQVYVIQALSYREYGLRVRGPDLVEQADLRALWAMGWFLLVYRFGPGRRLAGWLPGPPSRWSVPAVWAMTPPLVFLGLIGAGLALQGDGPDSAETALLRSFPIVMLVAAILLIVTGRNALRPSPAATGAGLGLLGAYLLIWTFYGKRSPTLMAVLAGICAWYLPRGRRPSKPILAATACAGILVVSLSIGWRLSANSATYERSVSGFLEFLSEFRADTILVSLNLDDTEGEVLGGKPVSHETAEWGGYLLMLATVPERSEYDFGASYLRIFSTYIPRIVWPSKPIYGREQWVNAWIAGSEFRRDKDFTGPAIGLLGAAQLNGGAWGTLIVLGAVALLLRTAYEFYRRHADRPWAQAWWSLTYFNSWLMVVNDDPLVWFYYVYGVTTLPVLVGSWAVNALARPAGFGDAARMPAPMPAVA